MDHIAIQKLRRNEPLTAKDIEEIERIFLESGVADEEQLTTLREEGGLGVLIRSMIGLDREAAKTAFAEFIERHKPTADQTEFLNMVIDYLTERGGLCRDRHSPVADEPLMASRASETPRPTRQSETRSSSGCSGAHAGSCSEQFRRRRGAFRRYTYNADGRF